MPLLILAALFVIVRFDMPLPAAVLVLFFGFLAGSKLVNEAYVFPVMALLTLVLARRPSPALTGLRTICWVVPLCYALINTPAWGFGLSAVRQLRPGSTAAVNHWVHAYQAFLGDPASSVAFISLGLAFSLTAVTAMVAVPLLTRRSASIGEAAPLG